MAERNPGTWAAANAGTPSELRCAHCGDPCTESSVVLRHSPDGSELHFCCMGCKSVYEILEQNDLCAYYTHAERSGDLARGVSMRERSSSVDHLAALADPTVEKRLLSFSSPTLARIVWQVPQLHCVSCVWLLEQLARFDAGILSSIVDIMRKTVTVDYDPRVTSLRAVAERMASLGYEPLIRLDSGEVSGSDAAAGRAHRRSVSRGLYTRLAVAGFAASNTMVIGFSQYFAGPGGMDAVLVRILSWLAVALSLPVLFYCASPWFTAARAALEQRRVSLDVPVAIGILVLFVRSMVDVAGGHGAGYLDSFTGLVFFLLIGRLFQQKAFDALHFDRTYRSFFPLSVRVERSGAVATVLPIEQIEIGDTLIVRNGEVIPCDSALRSAAGYVDYSFVTGESLPVECTEGETIYAGGKVVGRSMRLEASRGVSHSELAAMWDRSSARSAAGRAGTGQSERSLLLSVSDRFGTWFTVIALTIALAGALVWLPDWRMAFNAFTAVLIIACPCALTLATPITLGTAMGRLGSLGIYLKNIGVVLELDRIDSIFFDKTGTLTLPAHRMRYAGRALYRDEWTAVLALAASSTHPMSRAIARLAEREVASADRPRSCGSETLVQVEEILGSGIRGRLHDREIAIGSLAFAEENIGEHAESVLRLPTEDLAAALVIDGELAGAFYLEPELREGVSEMMRALRTHTLALISGDTDRDRPVFSEVFRAEEMSFDCRPEDKIERIEQARASGKHVLMVGDGLNDAGAMSVANVAIAVTDDTATLVPACDVILRATSLTALPRLLRYARQLRRVIVLNFGISIIYNAAGLTLAVTGVLTPLVAAVLMPVSSLTVIAVSVAGARWFTRRTVWA